MCLKKLQKNPEKAVLNTVCGIHVLRVLMVQPTEKNTLTNKNFNFFVPLKTKKYPRHIHTSSLNNNIFWETF